MLECALAVWPGTADESYENFTQVRPEEMEKKIQEKYIQVYGSPLLLFILGAVIQVIAKILIEWWIDNNLYRAAICGCKAYLEDGR